MENILWTSKNEVMMYKKTKELYESLLVYSVYDGEPHHDKHIQSFFFLLGGPNIVYMTSTY